MPIYVYTEFDPETNSPVGEPFELMQSITSDALTEHPETKKPVRRIPQIPLHVGLNEPRTLGSLAEKNTAKMLKEGSDKITKKDPNKLTKKDITRYKEMAKWSDSKKEKYIREGK